MKSLFKTIIKPYGERYNNTEGDLIVNASIDIKDYQYTNRIGVVVTPSHHAPIVDAGDLVIVHHNVFRQYWGFSTHLRTSSSDLDDGTFAVNNESIYAYNKGDGWVCLNDTCFITPVEAPDTDLLLTLDKYLPNIGKVAYGAPMGLQEGDTVIFKPYSEHKYTIDDTLMYRMKHSDIIGEIL